MSDDKPPVPYIYGARGEELQRDPDEPRSPWLFRACLLGVCIVVGVLWWMG